MARDAFDPGPEGTFPNFPRDADGSPAWSDSPATDGTLAGDGQARMPRGQRRQDGVLIDVTPRHPDGSPIEPPTLTP